MPPSPENNAKFPIEQGASAATFEAVLSQLP